MTVRRVTGDDGARLKAARLSALADAPSAFASTFDSEAGRSDDDWSERARAGATGPMSATFLAEDAGDVVGLVGAYRERPSDPRVQLVSMWVAPSHRRCGVGRALVDAVRAWAADTGGTAISLWVTRGNTPAEGLYRSLGFAETDDHQPLPSDPCKDERRMELRL